MTNEQLLMEIERLFTDLESAVAALRKSIALADELLPMSRRYATPRELGELATRSAQLEEHRAVLTRFIA